MRVLALDTTTASGSVAVVEDDRVLAAWHGDRTRAHAERLPGDLLKVLESAGLSLHQIDWLALARGPGSFTGLRVGIATVQGLSVVTGRRIAPISALEALAHASCGAIPPGGLVGVWMDGHRQDVFSALYRVQDAPRFTAEHLGELDAPSVGTPSDTWARWTARFGVPDAMAGDGVARYPSIAHTHGRFVDVALLAGTIGLLAARLGADHTVNAGGVQPLYLRRPDAEVARDLLQSRAQAGAGREGER